MHTDISQGRKRLNPETGKPFKSGDTREDGYIFRRYNLQKLRPNGEFLEQWYQPEAYERHNSRDRQYMTERHHRLVRELREYQLAKGCIDCGYKAHHAALEFDHRPDEVKLFNVSARTAGNPERTWAEVAKCDVVCANCHQIRTWQRLQNKIQ